ncbi:MAG: type II secretion system inner membrane protein GspF [Pseudomonadota bacterium]
MPVYGYKGVNSQGRPVSGTKDADTPKALRALLRRDGILATEIDEVRSGSAHHVGRGKGFRREVDFGKIFERVSRGDVGSFARQLATLLKAGIPLAESLAALFEQIDNSLFKTVIGDVREKVNEGSSLADALARHSRIFEPVFISMVRAGETAGNLDEVLARLADFTENQVKLRSKVVTAMIYPAAMVAVGTVIMGILMVMVVPKITQIFADAEQALPWNTVLLIGLSNLISDYWYVWIVAVPLGTYLLFHWIRSSHGRPKWDRLKLRLPVLGSVVRRVAVARFARTLGTMLASGVPLLRALDISREILGNVVLMKIIEDAKERIQQGDSIAATLKRSGEFPPLVTHMIAVGERAGQLEQMLANVATAYESEVDVKLGQLTSLLEPIMIVAMGGSVAFIVASILMPIMQMNSFVQ